VAPTIVVGPGVEFKPIEGDALAADGDHGDVGSDLAVEAIAVHAEVLRGIAQAQYAGGDEGVGHGDSVTAREEGRQRLSNRLSGQFAPRRSAWPLDWPARAQRAESAGRSLPGAVETRKPVLLLVERQDQQPYGQPVAIAGTGPKRRSRYLEVPAQVLELPLVGPDLPASIQGLGNLPGPLAVSRNTGAASSGEPSGQQPIRLPPGLFAARWPAHYLAEPM